MNIKSNTFVVISFYFIFFTYQLRAQAINSIYSMYGVGLMFDNNIGINKPLGGTGIAFKSGRAINHLNPASYLGILPNSFIGEIGAFGMFNKSKTNNAFQTDGNMGFNYFYTGFYVHRSWVFTLGIVPFSSIDYEVDSVGEINGELTSFEKKYVGQGGLYRANWGNSFQLFKGLAAGFNVSYIFGLVTQTETALENSRFVGYELKSKRFAGSVYLDYGMQYSLKKQDWMYTVGMIYGAREKLATNDDLTFTYNGVENSLVPTESANIEIPQKVGVGIAISNLNAFRVGFDYEENHWSNLQYSSKIVDLTNSKRYSLGAEIFPGSDRDDHFFKKLTYMIGANYKNSYLKIHNTPINSMGLNMGIGIPMGRGNSLNLSLEYGKEGTIKNGLIQNSYWGLFVNFSLYEFLYRP